MSFIAAPAAVALTALLAAGAACAACAQQPFREYPSIEHGRSASPEWDHQEHAEFVVGRLMYPQSRSRRLLGTGYGDWLRGGTAWTVDCPEGVLQWNAFATDLRQAGIHHIGEQTPSVPGERRRADRETAEPRL
jgi:hypothetical protein